MCAAIRQAAKDKTIKAILLRINSGGGSYTASDLMNREIVNAQAAGKKVVVSMGNVAASGGTVCCLRVCVCVCVYWFHFIASQEWWLAVSVCVCVFVSACVCLFLGDPQGISWH
jgi:hypothetical protein